MFARYGQLLSCSKIAGFRRGERPCLVKLEVGRLPRGVDQGVIRYCLVGNEFLVTRHGKGIIRAENLPGECLDLFPFPYLI
jgi:hypothetical protein